MKTRRLISAENLQSVTLRQLAWRGQCWDKSKIFNNKPVLLMIFTFRNGTKRRFGKCMWECLMFPKCCPCNMVIILYVTFDVLFAGSSCFNRLQNQCSINANMEKYLLCQMARITNNICLKFNDFIFNKYGHSSPDCDYKLYNGVNITFILKVH